MVSFLLTSNNNPGAHWGEMNNYHVVLKHISKQTNWKESSIAIMFAVLKYGFVIMVV